MQSPQSKNIRKRRMTLKWLGPNWSWVISAEFARLRPILELFFGLLMALLKKTPFQKTPFSKPEGWVQMQPGCLCVFWVSSFMMGGMTLGHSTLGHSTSEQFKASW